MPAAREEQGGEGVDRYRRRRTVADETGQVIVFALLAMVVLIGVVGFAVDVGHALLAQRQLQAGR